MPALRFCSREGQEAPSKAPPPAKIKCLSDEVIAAPDALRLAKSFVRFREKRKVLGNNVGTSDYRAIEQTKIFARGLGDALKVERSYSQGCLRKLEIEVKLALDPRFLRDQETLMHAVHLRLDPWVGQHKTELDGTLLMYTRIRLGGQKAAINGEFPFLHCLCTFDAIVFRAEPGKLLMGEVDLLSDRHVSLRVFGLINATINDDENNFEVEAEDETGNTGLTWRRKGTDEVIKKGRVVVFEAKGMKSTEKSVLMIDGSLASKKTKILMPTSEDKKRKAESFAAEIEAGKADAEKEAEEKKERKRARKARKEKA